MVSCQRLSDNIQCHNERNRPFFRSAAGRRSPRRADRRRRPVRHRRGRRPEPRLSRKTLRHRRSARGIGGTWDLFRYPGVRSDSDMYTLGYSFKPWTEAKAIADGPADPALRARHGRRVRHRRRASASAAAWSPPRGRARKPAGASSSTKAAPCAPCARASCTCAAATTATTRLPPRFRGRGDVPGHDRQPQFWPQDLDYTGKRVVVVGSGATAVTLVPAMAGRAAHVTMLQRSPTYVVSRPAEDRIAQRLRRHLPAGAPTR
jgi:monooxygenase